MVDAELLCLIFGGGCAGSCGTAFYVSTNLILAISKLLGVFVLVEGAGTRRGNDMEHARF